MIDISVIIPVYNTERCIAKTLDCIILGQFENANPDAWEVIVVDDGSTDSSPEILADYKKRYPHNVIVVNQQNLGASVARNVGIERARGKYLYFMDSDDLLLRNSLPTIAEVMERMNLDLVRFTMFTISYEEFNNADISTLDSIPPITPREISAYDFLDETRAMINYRGLWSVWSSMFSAKFVKRYGCRYIPGLRNGQDCLFIWDIMLNNPRMAVIDADIYIYQVYGNSLTTKSTPAAMRKRADALRQLADRLTEILKSDNPMISAKASDGLRESITYILQDLITARIALNAPYRDIYKLTDEFLKLGGKIDPTAKPFINRNAKYSLGTRLKAAFFTHICK